ncbi:MAG: hypothetical protein PHC88_15105 [Terrimicrobiaceae bacterium]|nr:hypothetical protein [Terrimicrobiaceae bacterium]
MPLDAATFEKLGAFYLGRPIDPATRQPVDAPFLYDSRDLVTHAVCVGMTGSGKTGLCIGLLEEAAIDGIPALIIDPKGDLTNLALQFPKLRAEDFRPWISTDEAARAGVSPDAFAESQAQAWRDGLARWGEDAARVERLQAAAEVTIFTPGSTAGRPISVLASFETPAPAIRDDVEMLAERVESTASALLGLAGISGDAMTSREHTLLSTILAQAWSAGESLSLVELVRRIQKPAFTTVGVLDLEAFYPAKERFKLVLALNNLLASPGFAAWQQGEPLDVQSFLFTPAGKPRLSVLSIAHLGDAERMFLCSLLLNAVVSWMRAQSGTTSLRALLYMDEVFGYFPPVANPPSKKPLLTLLKQARAFGLGVVLATQNPSDLDYKGLANAGTWFIGRLQTERDRARLLDGLGDAGAADREALEALLESLGKRQFVMNNVHESAPALFETRWTLSYLCGPLTRDQIRSLQPAPAIAVPVSAPTPAAGESGPPVLKDVPQVFDSRGTAGGRWSPRLLVVANLRYRDAKRGIDSTVDEAWLAPMGSALAGPDLSSGESVRVGDFTETSSGGIFDPVPAEARQARSYAEWGRDAAAWLSANRAIEIFRCAALEIEAKAGETERDFRARLALQLRESRDERADALRASYAKKLDSLQAQVQRATDAVAREEAQAGQARMQTMLSIGTTVLGAFLGRKAISASTLGRATTAARGVGRSMKEFGDVNQAKEKLVECAAQRTELEGQLASELAALTRELDSPEVETLRIAPVRGGVRVRYVALAWVPA